MKNPNLIPFLMYLLIPISAVIGSVLLFRDDNVFGGILLAVIALLSTPSEIPT